MRYFKYCFSLVIYLLIFGYSGANQSFAAFSFHIESIDPESVSSNDQEITVRLTLVDLPSESYFRIGWQEASGKPYFGYVKNNTGEWVKVDASQDCKNYYHVSDLSTQSLVLVTKVGQENAVDNGEYLLKARRYTASCSSYTDSEPITVQVNLPTPTSTPTPTSPPEPTSTPTRIPTPTPTSTKTPTPSPLKMALSPTTITTNVVSSLRQQKDEEDKKMIVAEEKKFSYPTSILGIKDKKDDSQKNNNSSKKESTFFPVNLIFILAGIIFLVICAILICSK
ncbi:MAG: hypothetical protein KatS3mg089_0266 [Patescibacteria group bacterium]|nr:MAG: hypothetical protein KatS3mg089_0266 [Patescibacteria group bacterium]